MARSRLSKLRGMPAREILGRLAYRAVCLRERRRYRRGGFARMELRGSALVSSLGSSEGWERRLLQSRARGPAFSEALRQRDRVRELFAGPFANEAAASRRIADRIRAHELSFFGRRFQFGTSIPWNQDPVTGENWPAVYHRDVPIYGGDRGYGDVKYVWELNRHQFLVDLGKTVFLDGSREDADEVERLLNDWTTQVPYATGVPWASALEPAVRIWSWLWAYDMLRQAGTLSDRVHLSWLAGFYHHAHFLSRHIETYSSPFNHLVGEASALYAVGLCFPEFHDAPRWRDQGKSVLERTVDTQFHSDGGTVEQSTFYHHATLGFYLLAIVLGRRRGDTFSVPTLRAIEAALTFSMSLVLPDGRVPTIGGADDGKPIRFEHLPFWDFRSYLAIGAVLFSRPDFKYVAGRFWEDALWLLGPAGLDEFESCAVAEPSRTTHLLRSGYTVGRSEWTESADYLCFDCGPQAGGLRQDDVPSAAHGHADCLSIVVGLGGQRVLVDPGFYCYNGDPQWESHFRRTGAHNTAVIDGRDQAVHRGKMDWSNTYTPRIEGWDPSANRIWARGHHDGYTRSSDGVVHRRTCWLREGGYVIVFDEFTGSGHHDIAVNFQFAPGDLVVHTSDAMALFDERFEVVWSSPGEVRMDWACGGPSVSDGWIAESLGVRRAAPRLTLHLTMSDDWVALLTILADRSQLNGDRRIRLESTSTERWLSARVAGPTWVDTIVASDGNPVTHRGIETDAALCVVRTANGSVAEATRVGGTYLHAPQGEPSRDLHLQPTQQVSA